MKERDIFTAALEIADPAAREAFLSAACADAESKSRVLALLRAEVGLGKFLETPAITAAPPGFAECPGTVIGPYKLMEQIGEGGMGLVFVAEQQEPVRRKVALKIIKPGMDSREVIARFEAERQALALMDHPNIAKVLDAGTTETGLPYFVMELVKGIPIVEYCDQRQLSARERLQLSLSVCQAVQHAHSKGIIHRDLKPSNILVAPHDGIPVVKVIDFGIAKAIGQQLTDKTIYTRFAQMIGTPLYMSPEQAEINAIDVDIRSDVYSLGVLLYELLTGFTPFDRRRFATAAFDEIRRIIREEDPPKPSTRLSTLGAELTSVSACRKIEPAKLSALVRGDLDWIVMKALEKDRTRRYETASALAADIRRFLAEEPIEARPPSAWYRFGKLARRNKVALLTAGLVSASLVLGTVASVWQAVRATAAEREARASEDVAQKRKREADDAKGQAERRRDELATLNESLRRANYVADMNLARHAWDENNLVRANELLEKHRPGPGDADLRGFEWHYLRRLFHGALVSAKAHGGWVTAVAFAPDGKRLFSSGFVQPPSGMVYGDTRGEVKLWDAETGRELRLRPDRPGDNPEITAVVVDGVERITLSPDGSHLAVVSSDHAIRVRDLATDLHVTLETPKVGFATALRFSPDGKRLVGVFGPWDKGPSSGLDSETVRVWNVATGKAVLTLDRLPLGAWGAFLSQDGQRLAVCFGYQGVVRVWDAATGREAFSCKYADGALSRATFSPDGRHLAACGEKGIQIWDVATQRSVATWKSDSRLGLGLVFSPDGKCLAQLSVEGFVELWDVGTGRKVDNFKGYSGRVATMAFSPDGRRLATGGVDGKIRVWDTTRHGKPLSVPAAESLGESVDLSPDGRVLLTGPLSGLAKSVQLWDIATGAPHGGPIETGNTVSRSHWTSDGKGLFLADLGNNVTVIDFATGKAVRSFRVAALGRYVTALSPDEKWFAHSAPTGKVKVLDARTGVEFRGIAGLSVEVHDLVFSPDSSRLVGSDESGALKIWDIAAGLELATTNLGGFYLTGIRFSPDGRRIALIGNLVQSGTGEVRILDAETGREVLSLRGHTLNVMDGVFSPDGRRLATASADRTIRIWDLATGQEVLKLSGMATVPASLRFISNGTRLLSATADRTVRLWDATPQPADER